MKNGRFLPPPIPPQKATPSRIQGLINGQIMFSMRFSLAIVANLLKLAVGTHSIAYKNDLRSSKKLL